MAASKRTTILLIEDSPSDMRLITESLRDAPHEPFTILTASTLAKGLHELERDAIDAILLDLSLPDSDGISTFHAVRNLTPLLPVVVLTMTDDDEVGLQMVSEGAQDYLPKTILTQETCTAALTRAIRYAIERKRLDEQMEALNERLHVANKELYALNEELRHRVRERTQELNASNEDLRAANEELRDEIKHRTRAEREAQTYATQLKRHTDQLEDLVEERTTQLKEAERLAGIGQTATMIGHDLRNPLQALQYSLELELKYFDAMPHEAKESVQVVKAIQLFAGMEQQILYMDKIVSDLQDYARPLTLEFEMTSIRALIDETLSTLTIPESITTHVEISDSITATTDPHLMQRVLSNLIMNAVQSMPQGGELTLEAKTEHRAVVMRIHDTGEGVPENMRDSLFSPLTTGKAKGTGLGLAVVKRIVEAHNGTISFASEEGKGTTFIVTLPRDA